MHDEHTAERLFAAALGGATGTRGELIPLLQAAQEAFGYVPEAAMERVADCLEVALADVYGVVTFYKQFRQEPCGRYLIRVCDGTACHVNDSMGLVEAVEDVLGLSPGQTDDDLDFTIETVACLGCCSLAPVIMVNDETHGRLTPQKLRRTLKKLKKQAQSERAEAAHA